MTPAATAADMDSAQQQPGGSNPNKSSSSSSGSGSNEQFCLLAKTAKGAAAVQLVRQALDAPGVHVFGELLDQPNVQALSEGAGREAAAHFDLLGLFAYGTYGEYLERAASLPALTPAMEKKLRLLTLASLASKTR